MSMSGAVRARSSAADPARSQAACEFSLEEFVPYRLAVLARDVSRSLATVYSERFGLSIAEWRVLAVLAHFGAMPAGLVAERSSQDKPKVTRALQRLSARKLVTRRTDAADRRAVEVALTAKGREVFEKAAALAMDWEQSVLKALTPEQRRAFALAIDALGKRVKAMTV